MPVIPHYRNRSKLLAVLNGNLTGARPRVLQELQTLQEENRRLHAGHGHGHAGPGRPASVLQQPDTADMVDSVLLQNQVDTLQWQLRQVSSTGEWGGARGSTGSTRRKFPASH